MTALQKLLSFLPGRRETDGEVRADDGDFAPRPMIGLSGQLNPEQRERLRDYDGPIASGERDLPRVANRRR